MLTSFIIGFFIGVIVGGWYASWLIKRLKRKGYLMFEITDKFKKDFNYE